jgi:hypothetical protein
MHFILSPLLNECTLQSSDYWIVEKTISTAVSRIFLTYAVAIKYHPSLAAANEATDDGTTATAKPASTSSGGASTATTVTAATAVWWQPAKPATQPILPPATAILNELLICFRDYIS